ncbi:MULTISPECIES: hypothetical protein [Pseudomonas]|uniref:Phage tail protein n=1 Tax=Pseudomonas putida (strain W619) TaxID=390235 RepID=B1JB16_PSEPW|nr:MULTISPECIES: hypothetical protein [Pseudomonas]MDH1573769.1 phage tail protein [Pseudomonas sp. GD03746]QQE82990.1 phage tail protein [Pseudomonas putida]
MTVQFFASKSTRGFYSSDSASSIPVDAVEITEAYRNQLLEGERAGRVIVWGDSEPFLEDPPPPTGEELAVVERRWRDMQLLATDGIVARHRDERDIGGPTTLNTAQFSELLEYRQDLRNWPQADAFPLCMRGRPPAPEWIAQLTNDAPA